MAVLFFGNDNMVSFEEGIGFVRWEVEFILLVRDDDSGPFCDFFPVAEFDIIGKSELAEAHKSKETGHKHCLK